MWGKPKRGVGAFLDDGSEIEGSYTCTGTVMLDAKLRGEITARDTLIIGDHGVVEATVRAAIVVVRGRVVGNVTASESVEAPHIVMEAGAVLDGRCRMTIDKPAEAPLSAVVVSLKG